MTTTDLNNQIAQGNFKVIILPTRQPRKSDLIMTRVGGSGSRWNNSTGGNGRLKAGQLRPDEIAIKSVFR